MFEANIQLECRQPIQSFIAERLLMNVIPSSLDNAFKRIGYSLQQIWFNDFQTLSNFGSFPAALLRPVRYDFILSSST